MDTGGGIMKARWFLEEKGAFLVHNIDIFSSIDLGALYEYHRKNQAIATLAVMQRITSRNLLIDEEGLLCGWRNNLTGSEIIVHEKPGLQALAFSGIHIIDPAIFEVLDREDPFPMTNAYLEIASEHRVMTYNHSGDSWIDMAHPNNFPELN
jgi:NDP-sugar pyrophosphorylase family protein